MAILIYKTKKESSQKTALSSFVYNQLLFDYFAGFIDSGFIETLTYPSCFKYFAATAIISSIVKAFTAAVYLRIAETAVELDDLRSLRSLHKTSIKDSCERASL